MIYFYFMSLLISSQNATQPNQSSNDEEDSQEQY